MIKNFVIERFCVILRCNDISQKLDAGSEGLGVADINKWSVFMRFVLNLLKLGGLNESQRTYATKMLTDGNSHHGPNWGLWFSIYLYVGFCVARSDSQGNAKTSTSGTSKKVDPTFSFF